MSPTYYVHPEFGFFCLAPAARRELRIAVASILFGMVIGAISCDRRCRPRSRT